MPEYSLRLQTHGGINGLSALTAIRVGYTDPRQLGIGDGIPRADHDPPTLLLFHGIADWMIDSVDGHGVLCCLPSPTQVDEQLA